MVDQEVDALEAAGHEVRRFERFSDDIAQFSVPGKVFVPVRVVRNPRTARQLDGALEQFGPHVVHLHNLFPLIGSSVLDSCQRQSVPCVVTFHNYRHICPGGALFRTGSACRDCVGHQFAAPGVLHGCYRSSSVATLPIAVANTVHRQAWRRVPSAYIFLSAGQQHELETLELPPSRCFVKPNFVPPVSPKEATGNAVVYLGRLTEAKGLRVLMQAWDEFTAGRTDTGTSTVGGRFRTAGGGDPIVGRDAALRRDARPPQPGGLCRPGAPSPSGGGAVGVAGAVRSGRRRGHGGRSGAHSHRPRLLRRHDHRRGRRPAVPAGRRGCPGPGPATGGGVPRPAGRARRRRPRRRTSDGSPRPPTSPGSRPSTASPSNTPGGSTGSRRGS